MQVLGVLVEEWLAAVTAGEVFWQGLGTFSLYTQRRMPGFPGYSRVMFRPSEQLFAVLNPNDPIPVRDGEVRAWTSDPARAARIASLVAEAIVEQGELKVPELGSFWKERRKTTAEDFAYVLFRSDPEVLRRLNPNDKAWEAAMAIEWPNGVAEEQPRGES
jgi:hypothetical protein